MLNSNERQFAIRACLANIDKIPRGGHFKDFLFRFGCWHMLILLLGAKKLGTNYELRNIDLDTKANIVFEYKEEDEARPSMQFLQTQEFRV